MTTGSGGSSDDQQTASADFVAQRLLAFARTLTSDAMSTPTNDEVSAFLELIPQLVGQIDRNVLQGLIALQTSAAGQKRPGIVTGHVLIGEGWAPGVEPPDPRGFFTASFKAHGDPYIHVRPVATSAETTVSGRLMEGSMIMDHPGDWSHFTVAIAKMSGVHLRAVWTQNKGEATRLHHELNPT
jgi:hypothetical protein